MVQDYYQKIPKAFYLRSNVVEIARDLIGKYLVTRFDHILTVARIVETEAYDGRKDRACHAYGRRTARTEVMYREGGIAYVYLCYGIHRMFNIVTNRSGLADAVLVRAVEPVTGLEAMQQRRGNIQPEHRLTAGPGSLTRAMGIDLSHNAQSLQGRELFVAEGQGPGPRIESDRRVGVDYAGADAGLPWRFMDADSLYVSRPKQKPMEK